MKHYVLIIVLVLFGTVSCKSKSSPINIIVPADLSNSRDSSVCDWYRTTIKSTILSKLGPKDKMTVLPLDFFSRTSSTPIFQVDFSKHHYKTEYDGLQASEYEANRHRDSVDAEIRLFDSAFIHEQKRRKEYQKGTDVVGSISECKRYVDPNYQNLIVLFTDGQQVTNRTKLNFEDSLQNEDQIGRYLLQVEKVDLSNISVIIITGEQKNISIEKFNLVKSFWKQYIQQNSGVLLAYSSGSTSELRSYLTKNQK